MRLRLRIERNQLPAVSTLWPVKDTQGKNTISQLLEQINGTFPLEGDDWGLEHYTVTIGGYECLHYHELGAVCKDEDEVVIRPLQYAEVRARTLTGRHQISADGRHLLDGLPFGRPLLRGVVRPEVRIPPRKRRRIEEAPVPEEEQGDMVLVRTEDDENELDEEDSEEEDDDFEMEEDEAVESDASSSEDEEDSSGESDSDTSDTSDTSNSSDSESDEDEDQHEDESVSEESWNGIKSAPPTPTSKKAAAETDLGARMELAKQPSKNDTKSRTSPSLMLTKSDMIQRGMALTDEGEEGQASAKDLVPPNQGKAQTRIRNARKRDSKKLQHLKKAGVLPQDANVATLHEWEKSNPRQKGKSKKVGSEHQAEDESMGDDVMAAAAAAEKDTSTETLDHLPAAEDRSTPKPAEESSRAEKQAHLEQQRKELLLAITSGGIKAATSTKRKLADMEPDDDEGPDEMSTKAPLPIGETNAGAQAQYDDVVEAPVKTATATKATDMVPAAVTRRSKLDLAGSKRLLYGSLGVRVPKTQEEKDALQKKLSDRAKQRLAPPTEATTAASAVENATAEVERVEPAEDGESWRDKIELTAVECCEDNVTLSTPPFPFYQRWDPQQRRGKAKGRNSTAYGSQQPKRKTKKGNVTNGELVETYDKYNINGGGDALNYDDVEDDDEYWEEGALLDEDHDEGDAGDEEQQKDAAAHKDEDDGFPILPADTTTLPLLDQNDALRNDYIVYTELTCSAATNWQPIMLLRTAQLQGRDDDGWTVGLPLRDMRPKEYDGDGKRIYQKFEMEGMSDDEGEGAERVRSVQWEELIEPRLLLRPEKTGDEGEREGIAGSETLMAA